MTWGDRQDLGQPWHELILGVRWYRDRGQNDEYEYLFIVEDESAVPSELVETTQINDSSIASGPVWASNPQVSKFWRDDMVEPPEQTAPPEQEPEANVPPEAVNTPPLVITRVQPDPFVVSSGPAGCTKEGAYAWSARFRVGQVQSDLSWIIQKVEITAPSGHHTLYEAFPVRGGDAESLSEDSYQANERRSSGSVVIKGLAQHFYFGGPYAPPEMKEGGSSVSDGEQWSSDTAPSYWVDGGTPHDLSFSWGAFKVELTTVPDSGPPEIKAAAKDLGVG